MKIRIKLLVGFISIAVIAGIIGIISMLQISKIEDSDKRMYEKIVVALGQCNEITTNFINMRVSVRDVFIADEQNREKKINDYKEYSARFDSLMTEYGKIFIDEKDEANYKALYEAKKAYVVEAESFIVLIKENKLDDARIFLYKNFVASSKAFVTSNRNLVDYCISTGKSYYESNQEVARLSSLIMIVLVVIGVFLAIALGFLIASNIQTIIKSVIDQAKMLSKAAVEGKLATRGDPEKINKEFREIILGVNETLDAVIGPLNVSAEYVDRISKGDIPAKITDNYNGDFNEIKTNLNQCIDAISLLVSDSEMLSKAAVEGKLATRADASKHQGDFKAVIKGVNDTLDAVIGPLNVSAEYIDRISKGEIPAKITDNYNGDFNEIKTNLNQCIDGLQGLVESNIVLKDIANNDYSVSVTGQYQGLFAEVGVSINSVAERLKHVQRTFADIADGNFSDLEKYKATGRRSEKDLIVPTIIRTIETIQSISHSLESYITCCDLGDFKKVNIDFHQY